LWHTEQCEPAESPVAVQVGGISASVTEVCPLAQGSTAALPVSQAANSATQHKSETSRMKNESFFMVPPQINITVTIKLINMYNFNIISEICKVQKTKFTILKGAQ
jgi:hypothetical protein